MKKHYITYLSFIVLFATACATSKPTQEKIDDITMKIQNRTFAIYANQGYPSSGGMLHLSLGYGISIYNDSVFTYLPFFGAARSTSFGNSDQGIKISEPIKNYQISPTKKSDGWNIKFNTNSGGYVYDFTLKIFNNGYASFNVISSNRDPISFTGEVL